jgi:hypothetical protein
MPQGDLNTLVNGLHAMITEQSAVQKHANETNARIESERIALEREKVNHQAAHGRTVLKIDFTVKIAVFVVLACVVAGGFYTGNISIVTHAATLVVGMVAGAGLASKR